MSCKQMTKIIILKETFVYFAFEWSKFLKFYKNNIEGPFFYNIDFD